MLLAGTPWTREWRLARGGPGHWAAECTHWRKRLSGWALGGGVEGSVEEETSFPMKPDGCPAYTPATWNPVLLFISFSFRCSGQCGEAERVASLAVEARDSVFLRIVHKIRSLENFVFLRYLECYSSSTDTHTVTGIGVLHNLYF